MGFPFFPTTVYLSVRRASLGYAHAPLHGNDCEEEPTSSVDIFIEALSFKLYQNNRMKVGNISAYPFLLFSCVRACVRACMRACVRACACSPRF